MKSLFKMLVLVAVAGWSRAAVADSIPDNPIPHQLNVQGVLRNAGGEVVNGTYNMVFTLWDQQTGGSVLFNSGTQTITVTGGVFNTYLNLGSTDPFKNRDSVWLQIQIGSDTPLPRRPITAVGFAYQAEHAEVCDESAAADSLACVGCVGDTQLGINYAGSTSKGGPATSLSCTGCIGSTHLADGGIATIDIGDLQVTTEKIAAGAVTRAKIANNAVGTQQIEDGQVMTADIADGAVTTAKLAAGAVTAAKLGVNWALGVSAGGAAADLQCSACVQPSEVTFNFAGSTSQGGAASDLACDATPCVSSAEVSFNYAGSTSKGGPATSLSCTDCVTAGMVQFNYAGSTSEGGPAKDLECSPAGCVGDNDLGVNYALGVSKGGAAADLQCSGCVQDSDLQLSYAYGDASHRATNVECSGCIGAGDIGAGVITDTHVSTTANIAGTKIAAATTSARGTVQVGTGLIVNNGVVSVDFAGSGSANTCARSDHTHSGQFLTDGGPFHLNQGNGFIFVDPDAPAPNEVYFHNPSGASSVVVELRLTHPGANADTSREFRIKTESANINAVTHRFYENGAAYHYGTLTLGGSLSCTNCVNSTAITDGTITNADIANVSGAKIQSGTSINLDTGDLTARYVYAYQFFDRDNPAYYLNPAGDSQVSSIYANNWFRAQGNTGIYFQDYGGGWYMTDDTWIRAYNNKPVYADNEIRSGSNMRAPIFYDLNDGNFYVDPTDTTHLYRSLYVDYPPNAAHNILGDFAPWLGGSAKGLAQYQYNYLFPGRVDGGGWQTLWYLGSHGSYGLYTNTGLYVASRVWAPDFYDANDPAYYLNPNGASQVSTIYANYWFRSQGQTGWYNESYGGGWYMTDTTWIRAYNGKSIWTPATMQADGDVRAPVFYDTNNTNCKVDPHSEGSFNWLTLNILYAKEGVRASSGYFFNGLRIDRDLLVYPSGGAPDGQNYEATFAMDIIPYDCNNCYAIGQEYAHTTRAWNKVRAYSIGAPSSTRYKKDIRDMNPNDENWALDAIRKARSSFYWFNEESSTREAAVQRARAQVEAMRLVDAEKLGERAREGQEERDANRFRHFYEIWYRPVPHVGVVLESLPVEVRVDGREDSHFYSLADMDGLLVAAVKALDRKLQEREQRITELEDRVALLEQVLVDAGILK